MTVFWRDTPLSESETKLLNLTLEAHSQSAMRDNISSVVLTHAARGSGDLTKSLIAALSTLGGLHAPLEPTYEFIYELGDDEPVKASGFVPGWGNSFVKGEPDPLWKAVDAQLGEVAPDISKTLAHVTMSLREKGRNVYPNPSAYTAAVGQALGISPRLLPWLFIQGRLSAWTALFQSVTKGVE